MFDALVGIADSPASADVAAFFDLDGTLVAGFTSAAHARHRIRHRQARLGELFGTAEAAVRYRYGRMEFDRLIVRAAGYLSGELLTELDDLGEELFHRSIRQRLHLDMAHIVAAHQQRGHTVVLSSSALTIHVAPVARALGIEHVICNHFELDGSGRLTGGVVAPIVWGAGKAQAAQRFSAANGIDLHRSYFYADGDEEEALMRMVGNPRPVNPRPRLAAVATAQGWPVLRVAQTRRTVGRRFGIGLNTSRG